MCLVFWYIQPQEQNVSKSNKIKYLLLFNREESFIRPTTLLNFEQSEKKDQIIYAKDIREGGTWLAINAQTGIIAFLTNRNILNKKSLLEYMYARYEFCTQFLPRPIQINFNMLYKSRGQLILNLVKSQKQKQFLNLINEVFVQPNNEISRTQNEWVRVETDLIHNSQCPSEYLDSLAQQTLLQKSQYRSFNLCFGSFIELDFRILSNKSKSFESLNPGVGSFNSNVDLIDETLEKQRYGMDVVGNLIKNYDGNEDSLVEQLGVLAMDEYKSGEKIFSKFEEESHLFIKKYKPSYGEFRGTRSTTIVIVTENKLRVFERTYQ